MNKRNLLNGSDKPVTVTGKFLFTVSQAALVDSLPLNPNNFGAREVALASAFRQFKFQNVTIRAHPTSQDCIVTYLKDVGTGAPTIADGYQGTNSLLISNTQTVPQTLTLSGLSTGQRPWYTCAQPAGANSDNVQGIIYTVTTATTAVLPFQVEIGYRITFNGAKDTNEN
jgi:hypothetical protein